MSTEPTELRVVDRSSAGELSPYERLLGDAMEGDTTLFARQDSVDAAWAIVDPVLPGLRGSGTPVHEYEPGTWGPPDATRLAADVGGWHDPVIDPLKRDR
jgi:glucose-6-phosphate 1-dehydrogenase